MMDSKLLYKCNPNKNAQCKKTYCKYNERSDYPVCELTSQKDFSIDGKAYKKVKTEKSFELVEVS